MTALATLGILSEPSISRLWSSLFRNAPSIDRLVSNYETHRSQFAALVRMAAVDPRFSLIMTKRGA